MYCEQMLIVCCLGIPNTKVFRDITKINDALILWEKLKRESGTREWKPEAEEEFEDREGNVFNKKLYDDLRAQGLL
jgi:splicing factor 3A subunit 3